MPPRRPAPGGRVPESPSAKRPRTEGGQSTRRGAEAILAVASTNNKSLPFGDPHQRRQIASQRPTNAGPLAFQFACIDCGETFTSKPALNEHAREHSRINKADPGGGDSNTKCKMCGKQFSMAGNCKRHERTVCGGQKDFKCQHCGREFAAKCNLFKHIKGTHEGQRDYKCRQPGCGAAFVQIDHLNTHERTVHRGEKNAKCPECPKAFGTRSSLNVHLRTVHFPDPSKFFECTECRKKFGIKSNYNVHVQTIHRKEKPYQCEFCAYRSTAKANLQRHQRRKHPDEVAKQGASDGQKVIPSGSVPVMTI